MVMHRTECTASLSNACVGASIGLIRVRLICKLRVCELRVASLRVCDLRVCEFTVGIYCLENAHLSVILCALTN